MLIYRESKKNHTFSAELTDSLLYYFHGTKFLCCHPFSEGCRFSLQPSPSRLVFSLGVIDLSINSSKFNRPCPSIPFIVKCLQNLSSKFSRCIFNSVGGVFMQIIFITVGYRNLLKNKKSDNGDMFFREKKQAAAEVPYSSILAHRTLTHKGGAGGDMGPLFQK